MIDLIVEDTNKRIENRSLRISLTKEAKEYIAESAYDPVFGARPLKRYMQKNVETLSARLILSGEAGEGSEIEITAGEEGLRAKVKAS